MESSVAWEIEISENKDLDNIFVLFLILGLLSVMNHFVYDKYYCSIHSHFAQFKTISSSKVRISSRMFFL